MPFYCIITKTYPCNKQRFFKLLKIIGNFELKSFDIFFIFAQNIDCGYTLEPPCRGGSNEYPQSMFLLKIRQIGIHLLFFYIKVGFSGVYFSWICFPDDGFDPSSQINDGFAISRLVVA